MKTSGYDPIPDPMTPACAAARSSLQLRLDRETESEAVLLHRAACPDCQSWEEAACRMERALKLMPSEVPPANLADRVLAQMRAEPIGKRRPRFRLLAASLALAASVLIAVFAIARWTEPDEMRVVMTTTNQPELSQVQLPGPDPLSEAGSALSSLMDKAAGDRLTLKLPSFTIPKIAPTTGPLERLEPAVASMQEVRHSAVFSVAPITRSAKRAADLFWREVPDLETKPGTN